MSEDQVTDFQRGVEIMRKLAIALCHAEARHARSHAGDPRYAGRADGAEACAAEIERLGVLEDVQIGG